MRRITKRNVLVNSPHYSVILTEYNSRSKLGKVNATKFYYEVIAPAVTGYSLSAWYKFLKDFKVAGDLVAVKTVETLTNNDPDAEKTLLNNLATRESATRTGLLAALNLGSKAIQQALKEPEKITLADGMKLLFGAMKAEDSRIVAIGKVRKDLRDEELFNKAMDDETYG